MNIKIRPATIEDRQALWQVHTQAIRQSAKSHYNAEQIEAWAGRLTSEYYTPDPEVFIIAEAESAGVVGFGEINIQTGEIEAVFVAPEYGRLGIGHRLLQALEDIAVQCGSTHLVLDASLNAVAFYERMGYRQKEPTVQRYGKDAVEVPGMLMTKSLDNLECYLRSDEVIDWRNPDVSRKAYEITAGPDSDVEKGKVLFEWVRDTIPHTNDAGREEVTCTASEVLSVGTGICYAKAHLLAALLRSVGIPAGFCYQVYSEELHVSESKMALHGLNAIYLQSLGKWIRVDVRGNKEGVSAQFDTEIEHLAFPELEFLDSRIYADPLPIVVHALRTWPTRTSLWPHLPGVEELKGHDNGTRS